MKKITRRTMLGASLGATQLALLDRFAFGDNGVGGGGNSELPTRLLVLYVPGGCRFHEIFCPFSASEINTSIPPNDDTIAEPLYFGPDDLFEFGGDSGGYKPLRMGARWNRNDPSDRTGYNYSPLGYSWEHYGLGDSTAVIHGVDNFSVAHQSAQVAAMCGLAGGSYRAPAMISVVANYLHQRFQDTRPVPAVSIRSSGRGGIPRAPGLPGAAMPMVMSDLESIQNMFSSAEGRQHWQGSSERFPTNLGAFGTSGPYDGITLTNADQVVLQRTSSIGGLTAGENVGFLERIHQNYAAVSNTLSLDVVGKIESVTPTTLARPAHLASYLRDYGFTFGLANYNFDMTETAEWVLSLMKSDVTSAVYANLPEVDYDTHGSNIATTGHGILRGQMDVIARILGEMKATPSPDRPGCSLYDDTVVVIQSEFNRSIPRGPNRESTAGWNNPDSHNNVTSVILSGGAVAGNRQIGGFDLASTVYSIAPGLPVDLTEEDGEVANRPPKAADIVSTVADLFGMQPGADYFIPGGYGTIQGLKKT